MSVDACFGSFFVPVFEYQAKKKADVYAKHLPSCNAGQI
jgi:hypothetical protein